LKNVICGEPLLLKARLAKGPFPQPMEQLGLMLLKEAWDKIN